MRYVVTGNYTHAPGEHKGHTRARPVRCTRRTTTTMARYKSGSDHAEVLHAYVLHLQRQGKAVTTCKATRLRLRAFLNDHPGDTWQHVTTEHLERWADDRRGYRAGAHRPVGHGAPVDGPKVARNTRAGLRYMLGAFYGWAVGENYLRTNVAAGMVKVHKTDWAPQPLDTDTVGELLGRYPTSTPVGMAIALMAYAGLRCMEVATLTWGDVDRGARRLNVMGKGSKLRHVDTHPELLTILAARGANDAPVIGARWSPSHVSRMVKDAMTAAGVQGHAHQLRHTFATAAYNADGNLLALQQVLGHKSVDTTQVYVQVADRAKTRLVASVSYGPVAEPARVVPITATAQLWVPRAG